VHLGCLRVAFCELGTCDAHAAGSLVIEQRESPGIELYRSVEVAAGQVRIGQGDQELAVFS